MCAAQNNPRTRNLNTLVGITAARLRAVSPASPPADLLNTVNVLFLTRTFLKYAVDTVPPHALVAQLDAGKGPFRGGFRARSPLLVALGVCVCVCACVCVCVCGCRY